MAVVYKFICNKEVVLQESQEEVRGQKFIDGEELVKIEISIPGYTKMEPAYVKKDHLDFLRKKLLSFKEGEKNDLFSVRYQAGLLSSYTTGNPLVIEGCYFSDGGYKTGDTKWLGYAGRIFKYKRHGSDKVVTTNNMWNGTEIDSDIIHFMPNNAEWAKEEN